MSVYTMSVSVFFWLNCFRWSCWLGGTCRGRGVVTPSTHHFAKCNEQLGLWLGKYQVIVMSLGARYGFNLGYEASYGLITVLKGHLSK